MFSRVDKKRGTYRIKESVRLNRPTIGPNRVRKHNGRRGSASGENSDQPTGTEWAVRRHSAQVLQLGEWYTRHCLPVWHRSTGVSCIALASYFPYWCLCWRWYYLMLLCGWLVIVAEWLDQSTCHWHSGWLFDRDHRLFSSGKTSIWNGSVRQHNWKAVCCHWKCIFS